MSVHYVDILRFVRMLIGSEITYGDALSILYEVHVKGNHADGDKVLLKESCHEITLPAAKARFAQVLRNSPRAMPLTGYPLTRGCPARHLMMPCQGSGGKPCVCPPFRFLCHRGFSTLHDIDPFRCIVAEISDNLACNKRTIVLIISTLK